MDENDSPCSSDARMKKGDVTTPMSPIVQKASTSGYLDPASGSSSGTESRVYASCVAVSG